MIFNHNITKERITQGSGGESVNKIKEYRLRKELTQQQLADRVGVDQSAVVRWEQGKANPTVENLVSMAGILECSVDALLGLRPA